MGQEAFFASAVQVIPVLFLVLALELRYFEVEQRLPRGWEDRLEFKGWDEQELPAIRKMTFRIIRFGWLYRQLTRGIIVGYVALAEIMGFIALLEGGSDWMAVVLLVAIALLVTEVAIAAFGGKPWLSQRVGDHRYDE